MGRHLQSGSTPRTQIAEIEARVLAIAEKQEGMIARRQLVACGMSKAGIARWVERGRLHRHHPGVYSLGHRRTTERGRLVAALLYAGPGAALAGRSGAAWWKATKRQPRTVEVASPHRRRSVPGVTVRHRPGLERVLVEGLPATPLARTLRDLASQVSRHELRKALAEVDYRGRLDPEAIQATRGPGSAALRRALRDHLPLLALTRNDLEEAFLGLCETHGLPLPRLNEPVGPYTIDALWPDHGLAVELDGGAAHGRPAAVITDRSRELYLRERGYRIVRYSWLQIFEEPERVAADLINELHAADSNSTKRRANLSGSGRSSLRDGSRI